MSAKYVCSRCRGSTVPPAPICGVPCEVPALEANLDLLPVIAILALAMGIQNILIRRWGIPDLATNVMTKTVAFLVADSTLGGGNNHHAARRGVSIVIFAVGATVGAFLTRYGVLWPILTSFTLFVLALPILLQPPDE